MNNLEQSPVISLTSGSRELSHPDDVAADRRLSLADKRALLAALACDERTVPQVPTMRQLDNGAIVRLTSILRALQNLHKLADARPRLLRLAALGISEAPNSSRVVVSDRFSDGASVASITWP